MSIRDKESSALRELTFSSDLKDSSRKNSKQGPAKEKNDAKLSNKNSSNQLNNKRNSGRCSKVSSTKQPISVVL